MTCVVAICNRKGGCGKTTTAVNLAAELGRRKIPTLVIDLDSQGHAGIGLGIAAAFLGITLFIKKAFAPKGRDAEAELAQRLALIKRNELA